MNASPAVLLKVFVGVGLIALAMLAVRRAGPATLATTTLFLKESASIAERAGAVTEVGYPHRNGVGLPADPAQQRPTLRAFAESLKALQTDPNTTDLELKSTDLALSVARSDLPAALSMLQGPEISEIDRAVSLRLIRRWAELSPGAAADGVLKTVSKGLRMEAIDEVATVWGHENLADASAWVRQLPEEAEREQALIRLAYEASRTDPEGSLKLAMELRPNAARDELVRYSASEWATKSPRAAAEWAGRLEDPSLRDRVLGAVASTWGDREPGEAANFAVKALSPGRSQDDAVVGIVQRWAQTEPKSAAAWVAVFPDSDLADIAGQELVKLWSDRNMREAGDWVDTLPVGPLRDAALEAYAGKMVLQAPESAVGWASKISDPVKRTAELERIGESWLASAPAAARTWIQQATLPDASKARLLAASPTP